MAKEIQKKETPTQKLKRELKEVEAQRDGYQKDASDLRKQIEGKLEETDKYKNLVKQVSELTLERSTAIKQRDRYKADAEKLQDQLEGLKDQLEELQDRLKELEDQADQNAEDEEIIELEEDEVPFWNLQDDERTKKVADYIKKAYAYSPQKKIIEDVEAESIAGYWRTITASKDAFDYLIEYFEGRLSQSIKQLKEKDGQLQTLELQAKDKEATNQFNATMGNYAALSKLRKERDDAVKDYKELQSKLGRPPKLSEEQETLIYQLRAEGLSMAKIAQKLDCSPALVHKIIHKIL